MEPETKKRLLEDPDGLSTYEYIANNVNNLSPEDADFLADNMTRVDLNGQFVVSAARYLAAIDKNRFKMQIGRLANAAIDRDRERRYLPDLMTSLYGPEATDPERARWLSASDDTFRRMYKRIYPATPI